MLSVKEKVFLDSDESALSIIPSDRSTRFSLDGNRLSITSDDGDIQYIRLSFEDDLFTSHVYKRNYRFPTKQTKIRDHILPGPQIEDLRASSSSEPETKTLTGAVDDEVDEEFSQGQVVVRLVRDRFAGELSEMDIDQPQSSVLGHDTSTASNSHTTLAPLILTTSSENNSENGNNTNDFGAASATLLGIPTVRTERVKRIERDKKTMLSRALQKANTAVLLDNALNFEGALEVYEESCNLLQRVMIRSRLEEDRIKLDAIVSVNDTAGHIYILIAISE
jgi:hypothetical protein